MDKVEKKALIQIISPLVVARIVTPITWLCVAIIIISGMLMSYYFSDWNILSRSGGIVIVCALLLALFDYKAYVDSFFQHANEYFGPKLKDEQLKGIRNEIKQDLKRYRVKKSENEIDFMAFNKFKYHLPGTLERLGNSIKMQSIKSEIAIAIIGTIISSFGDLIAKIPFLQ